VTDGRKFIRALLALLVAAALGLFAVVSPAFADKDKKPDLQTVKAEYDQLNQEADAASERANDAKHYIAEAQVRLAALNSDVENQQERIDSMRQQIATLVVEQYQSQALATASQLVLSADPDHFIDNLNAVSSYNDQRSIVLTD